MQLKGKNILLISPEPWDHIYVSKHHYARHLAERGNQVVFVNPAAREWKVTPTDIPKLRVLNYPKFLAGLRYLPAFISQRLIKRKFKQIQRRLGVTFDIIWSFDNSVFFDFTLLPTFNISHIVDLNQDFETKKAAASADLCLGCTDLITHRLKPYNPNTYLIQHGYNEKPVNQPATLPGQNKIKALYAGNLDMPYLDWALLKSVVASSPEVDFILIGPWTGKAKELNETSQWAEQVMAMEQVYPIGRVESDELSNYYAAADLLMVLYQEKHHHDQSNPHKMMEYLGTGRPIVATFTAMFEGLDSRLIQMSKKNSEYPELFQEILKSLASYQTTELCAKRQCIARDNSYPKQIERIEKLMSQHG